jgi:hypothetical protein
MSSAFAGLAERACQSCLSKAGGSPANDRAFSPRDKVLQTATPGGAKAIAGKLHTRSRRIFVRLQGATAGA